MKERVQSATTLPAAPRDERRVRVVKYAVTMTIRMVCLILMLFVQGWWLLVVGIGAVFLPYVAVILANAGGVIAGGDVRRPGALVPVGGNLRNEEG
jgi:hypothetical protein